MCVSVHVRVYFEYSANDRNTMRSMCVRLTVRAGFDFCGDMNAAAGVTAKTDSFGILHIFC